MELLLSSIAILSRWDVIAALLVGSVGGVIIGAIPGVGPAVAIAILLPATFSLDPIVGLTVLLGVYGSSMYGGAIPAILINTPGTAVNALTTYEGTPMTKRGEARRALSLAYSASFFGGIFSIACLIFLSPVLALVAPMFGSREIFLAALLGMILVILVHRKNIMAAGMLACFGIWLNTIGLESIQYSQRYTFGLGWLSGGINLIVVVLGLFALSQAFLLLVEPEKTTAIDKVKGNMLLGFKELAIYKRVAAVSASFGVLMGMIPGVGEFTAQFLSYSYAQKTSDAPEAFGRGAADGLVASEASNNAVPLYIALLILNVLVLLFLLFSTNALLKVIQIPTRFLGIVILTLSFVGVYSLRNSAIDCAIAACFGILGFILKRLDLPIVPIILGMVLGGIMENKLRTSMMRVDTPLDFINRPISFIIFMLIIFVIGTHFWSLWRSKRK